MIVKDAKLLITAVKPEQYPEVGPIEIALAGRSNVGKSSMINTLINRKKLARTSSSPGKTQTLNFYEINNLFRFVDLPGYGYAKVSKSERDAWGRMINTYLKNRPNLGEVFLLLDIRHKPNENDILMYNWILEQGFAGYIVATKADKLSGNDRVKAIKVIMDALNIEDKSMIIPFSTLKKMNIDSMWRRVEMVLASKGVDFNDFLAKEK